MAIAQVLKKYYAISIEKSMSRSRQFCINHDILIKTLLFLGYLLYIFLLVFDIVIASFFGYNVISHYISELGSNSVIPFPFIHDVIALLGGSITVISNFYYIKRLKIQYRHSKSSKIFVKIGFLSGILGALGYIALGIFSLDRGGPGGILHGIAMGCSFIGFIASIFFYSLNIILTHKCNLKCVGGYGMIFPLIFLLLFAFTNHPLAEWIVLYSILGFILFFDYYIFLKRES